VTDGGGLPTGNDQPVYRAEFLAAPDGTVSAPAPASAARKHRRSVIRAPSCLRQPVELRRAQQRGATGAGGTGPNAGRRAKPSVATVAGGVDHRVAAATTVAAHSVAQPSVAAVTTVAEHPRVAAGPPVAAESTAFAEPAVAAQRAAVDTGTTGTPRANDPARPAEATEAAGADQESGLTPDTAGTPGTPGTPGTAAPGTAGAPVTEQPGGTATGAPAAPAYEFPAVAEARTNCSWNDDACALSPWKVLAYPENIDATGAETSSAPAANTPAVGAAPPNSPRPMSNRYSLHRSPPPPMPPGPPL
jgi:hypothetical protein